MKTPITIFLALLFVYPLFAQDYTSSDNIRFEITLLSYTIIYVDKEFLKG